MESKISLDTPLAQFFIALASSVSVKEEDNKTHTLILKELNQLLVQNGFVELPPFSDPSWSSSSFPSEYNNRKIQVSRYTIKTETLSIFIGTDDLDGAFGIVNTGGELRVSKPGKNGTVFGEPFSYIDETVTSYFEEQKTTV
jgi:hypothetical protein